MEMLSASFNHPLDYACKCFFNHSAVAPNVSTANQWAFEQIASSRPPGTLVQYYFAVVDLATGLRVTSENATGRSCPEIVDPTMAVVRDSSSPTDYYCACPDPGHMQSSNLLTIPMVGIGIAFLGAVLSSLGQVTMKWVHTHNELRPLKERRIYFLNPLWYAALMTYLVSQVMTVLSYTSISQGENAVIGTFSLAANAVFAKHFLGEAMTRLHYIGILSIATGAVLVLISTLGVRCANSPEALQEVAAAMTPGKNTPFFIFVCLLGLVILTTLSVRRWGQWRRKGGQCSICQILERWVASCISILLDRTNWCRSKGHARGDISDFPHYRDRTQTPLLRQTDDSTTKLKDMAASTRGRSFSESPFLNSKQSSHMPSQLPRPVRQLGFGQDHYSERAMLFVTISASMGTISSFCASATVKLVTTHIRAFGESIGPWILVAVFLMAVLSSMHYLNRGLESGQALLVVPGFFTLNTMLAMICSLLYQRTYIYLSLLEICLFITGMAFAIVGVIAMVWREVRNDPDRMEQWAKRVAASPRAFESTEDYLKSKRANSFPGRDGDTPNGPNSRPPMHPNSRENALAYAAADRYARDIYKSNSVPIGEGALATGSSHSQNISNTLSGHVSPMLSQSGSGDSNTSSSRPGSGPNSLKTPAPIAVGPDMVDALSNQGNRSSVPYSHTLVQ